MPALNTVDILLNSVVVAESVPLEYCIIFARALFDEYYDDTTITFTIRRHEGDDNG